MSELLGYVAKACIKTTKKGLMFIKLYNEIDDAHREKTLSIAED